MYQNVMVGLDNSNWSELAMQRALELSKPMAARLVGIHVYAAAMHGQRFRQMESGLPIRYSQSEIKRQRSIHGVLIGQGLEVISRSYLEKFERCCQKAKVQHNSRLVEGRNWECLVRESSQCDLAIVGAHGLGHVERATIGSVCERLVRLASCDVLVIRNAVALAKRKILVALDGSHHSENALMRALELANIFSAEVVAVAAYDPFFHGAAFRGLAQVLSHAAARLFRFREQEALHDEVINRGLAQVYRNYLENAENIASRQAIGLSTELLDGKAFDAITSFANKLQPAMLVVGRHGLHHRPGLAIGCTAENLLRSVDCDVLVVSSASCSAKPTKYLG